MKDWTWTSTLCWWWVSDHEGESDGKR